MSILYIMIPVSLVLGFGFVAAFVWGVGTGQFDDTETPPHRILED
jgi:cbb3-type cytochrome oxidase maturation protein